VSAEVDARGLVRESVEPPNSPGGLWLATDRAGHPILTSEAGKALLGCSLGPAESLAESSNPACRELWRVIKGAAPANESTFSRSGHRIAVAWTSSTGWPFAEIYTPRALARITS